MTSGSRTGSMASSMLDVSVIGYVCVPRQITSVTPCSTSLCSSKSNTTDVAPGGAMPSSLDPSRHMRLKLMATRRGESIETSCAPPKDRGVAVSMRRVFPPSAYQSTFARSGRCATQRSRMRTSGGTRPSSIHAVTSGHGRPSIARRTSSSRPSSFAATARMDESSRESRVRVRSLICSYSSPCQPGDEGCGASRPELVRFVGTIANGAAANNAQSGRGLDHAVLLRLRRPPPDGDHQRRQQRQPHRPPARATLHHGSLGPRRPAALGAGARVGRAHVVPAPRAAPRAGAPGPRAGPTR